MKLAEHSCGDSRLTCNDCEGPVCPKCMVECPVGYRCKKCAGKITSHVLQVTPAIIARTIVVAGITGYVAPYLAQYSGGFYGFIIIYFVAVLAGNLLHKVSGYKMGTAIVSTVMIGAIAGMLANPVTFRSYQMQQDLARLSMQMKQQAPESQSKQKLTSEQSQADKERDMRKNAQGPFSEEDGAPGETMTSEQLEMTRQHFQSAQVWEIIELAIFLAGLLTPFTGVMPALPFPFFRR